MNYRTIFHPSLDELDIWAYKHLSHDELEEYESSGKIIDYQVNIFIEFASFNDRKHFVMEHNDQYNIQSFKKRLEFKSFKNLPILNCTIPYEKLDFFSKNNTIIQMYGNHQVFLCMENNENLENFSNVIPKYKSNNTEGIVVAIIDSGIDFTNKNLKNCIVKSFNYTNEDNNDYNGHGTFLAGIVASSHEITYNNQIEIIPNVKLINIKIFDKEGTSTLLNLLSALDDLCNLSLEIFVDILLFGCTTGNYFDDNNLISKYCKILKERNISIVAPSGNFGPDLQSIGFPGLSSEVLCVGGLDQYNHNLFFPGRGKENDENSKSIIKPDIVFPAKNIISIQSKSALLPLTSDPTNLPKGYSILTGTSIAAALCTQYLINTILTFPNKKPEEYYEIIRKNAKKLDLFQSTQGYGVINPKKIQKKEPIIRIKGYSFSKLILESIKYSSALIIISILLLII